MGMTSTRVQLSSSVTSDRSNNDNHRHHPRERNVCLVPHSDHDVERVRNLVQEFYQYHDNIPPSHGWSHVQAVFNHAFHAIACLDPPLSPQLAMEIQVAALLHDVDDHKYFPLHKDYENARRLLERANISSDSIHSILYMISLVSCSQNGNSIPPDLNGRFYLLIPRWADRLEAVGSVGVVRCYQYNQENHFPLSSCHSPRPQSVQELWDLVTPERFILYQQSGGASKDMISHYYNKLLHIARPPKEAVCNPYLERMAEESSQALVEVCLRFGKTGQVDEEYIQQLAKNLVGKSV